jgi:hypothetical protein
MHMILGQTTGAHVPPSMSFIRVPDKCHNDDRRIIPRSSRIYRFFFICFYTISRNSHSGQDVSKSKDQIYFDRLRNKNIGLMHEEVYHEMS